MSDPSTLSGTTNANEVGLAVDRRRSERIPFSGMAEVTDLASRGRIDARVADISLLGCYLDALNVFSDGSAVRLSIRHNELQLQAEGIVAYALPGMGMGVRFSPLSSESKSTLHQWIAEVVGETAPAADTAEAAGDVRKYASAEGNALGQLIHLMIRKGFVTKEEGRGLLHVLLLGD